MAAPTDPVPSSAWRKSPFIPGRAYLVKKDFEAFRDDFDAGEVLTYDRDTYSAYHGYTGFLFSEPGGENVRVWDLHDNEDLEVWRDLFEEMP